MSTTSSHTCPMCETEFEGGHNAVYCPDCRVKRRQARQKTHLPEQTCERCGYTFQPYRSGQRYCTECSRDNTGHRAIERTQQDEQMSRLFHNYEAKSNITIDQRDEGTRLVSLSDLQLPFVDEPLLDAVVEFISEFKPHDIILNGDVVDMYEVSDFDKNPERMFNLSHEVNAAQGIIQRIKRYAAKDCRLWWVDGNHEERFARWLWRHTQVKDVLPTLWQLLDLDNLATGAVPYGRHVEYLGFVFTHGNFVSSYSAYTAKRHYERYRSSGVNGHTHRLGSYSATDMHGRTHTWYEQGCLCRTDLEYVRGIANWQQGFLWGVVHENALYPQLAHVIQGPNGRGFYAGGKHYRVNDG